MSSKHPLATILLSNIVSLKSNRNKLVPIIDTIDPDIINLNETQLTSTEDDLDTLITESNCYDVNCHVFKIRHESDRANPPISGSSVFTCSKTCSVHFEQSPDIFEIISAKIKLSSKKVTKNIRMIHAYLSPSSSNDYVNRFYTALVDIINSDNNSTETMITGDFNSKDSRIHPTSSPNYHGKVLYNFINGLPIHDSGPTCKLIFRNNVHKATRFGRNSQNLLDLVLSSSNFDLPIVIEHIDLVTDHESLVIKIVSPLEEKEIPKSKIIKMYKYDEADQNELHKSILEIKNDLVKDLEHQTIDLSKSHRKFKRDWKRFLSSNERKNKYGQQSISDHAKHKLDCSKLDLLTKELEISLINAFNKHVPNKDHISFDLDRSSVLFPSELKSAYKRKFAMYNKLKQSNIPPNSNHLYRSLVETCKYLHDDFTKNWYNSLILPGRSSSRAFYSKTRHLLGKSSTKHAVVVKHENGKMGNTREAAEIFSKNFSKKLADNTRKNTSKKFSQVEIDIPPSPFYAEPSIFIKALHSLNNKLSSGFDQINNRLLKICKPAMASLLTILSNEIFRLSHWPVCFKDAKAIVLYKKDDPNDPNNFRVIALLSCISKVIEKVILEQLLFHFNINDLFFIRQAGYRTQHSCDDITADLIDEILKNKNSKYLQSALFLDYTGAFDFMSIDRLVVKLYGYRLLSCQVKLLESYLTNRNFRFSVNGYTSSRCWLSSGCSQGSCLGPILFLIFINDLPSIVKYLGLDYLFADDECALDKDKDAKKVTQLCQRSAKRLQDWSHLNNCIISIKKTKVMFLGKGDFGPIKINNTELERVKSFKYLGNCIDSELKGDQHLARIKDKVNASLANIRSIKMKLSLEKLLQCCQTFTFPLLTQGFKPMYPLMNQTNKDRWEKLSVEIQKTSLSAPKMASKEICDKICPIPTLTMAIKRALTKDSIKVLNNEKSNSLTKKMIIKIPSQDNKRRKIFIEPTHPKSGITLLANHVNEAQIKDISDSDPLFRDFRPKLAPQTINSNLNPADRQIIRNLSLNVLSREKLSRCDNRIQKYCTDCQCQGNGNKIEDTTHLIKCSSKGATLFKEAETLKNILVSETERRLRSTTLPHIKNQCLKLLEHKIYDDNTDIILGIGKVQLFKEVSNKKYKKITSKITELQTSLIPILARKNRLHSSYYGRIDALLLDQIRVPALSVL